MSWRKSSKSFRTIHLSRSSFDPQDGGLAPTQWDKRARPARITAKAETPRSLAGCARTFAENICGIHAICSSLLASFSLRTLRQKHHANREKHFVPNLSVCGCDSLFTL